jgi:hypothetical protein
MTDPGLVKITGYSRRALLGMAVGCAVFAAILLTACSSSSSPNECHAGCLCFTTPETCPASCYPAHDNTGQFFCSNGPPNNADAGSVDSGDAEAE